MFLGICIKLNCQQISASPSFMPQLLATMTSVNNNAKSAMFGHVIMVRKHHNFTHLNCCNRRHQTDALLQYCIRKFNTVHCLSSWLQPMATRRFTIINDFDYTQQQQKSSPLWIVLDFECSQWQLKSSPLSIVLDCSQLQQESSPLSTALDGSQWQQENSLMSTALEGSQ